MAEAHSGNKTARNQLRRSMLARGCTLQEIALEMAVNFGVRPRAAWRHAYSWTQEDVADRYNNLLGDPNAPMTARRISDYEAWPVGGVKPTISALSILARVFSTVPKLLIDHADRRAFPRRELLVIESFELKSDSPSMPSPYLSNPEAGTLTHGIETGIHMTGEFYHAPRQVPPAVKHFVGRSREIAILTDQISHASKVGTPVVITAIGGAAGIGKTTLAVKWAQEHLSEFPDGQLYLNLRGYGPQGSPLTPEEALQRFLDAFNVPDENKPSTFDGQLELYHEILQDKQVLVVLDNAKDSDQVRPLLPRSSTCRVLVTSRRKLGGLVAHERASHVTLDVLAANEARELLASFRNEVSEDPELLDQLARLCGLLPIALTIVAARLHSDESLSVRVLIEQLEDRNTRLREISAGDGQNTDISSIFSWSYNALPSDVSRIFRSLGLNTGLDIGIHAASSLVGWSIPKTQEGLRELCNLYLVRESAGRRYDMHDLVSAFAYDRCHEMDSELDRRNSILRLLDFYLHSSLTADSYLNPQRDRISVEDPRDGVTVFQLDSYEQAAEWFAKEHFNLVAAIHLAADHGLDDYAWKIAWTFADFLDRRGHWHDSEISLEVALRSAIRVRDDEGQARICRWLGRTAARMGRPDDAAIYYQRALQSYRNFGDQVGEARIHRDLSSVNADAGRRAEALAHAEEALLLYRARGNPAWTARALRQLALCQAEVGQHLLAKSACLEGLDLLEGIGDRNGRAQLLDSLGYSCQLLGSFEEATSSYLEALRLRRELGDTFNEAITLMLLGNTYKDAEDLRRARASWELALKIFQKFSHPYALIVEEKLRPEY